ncbi:TNF receptor-associated factor 5-like isoform X3 [Acropora palmata]
MNQPVSMACGHSACKACLQKMLSNAFHRQTCPLCRDPINPGKLNINLAVKALISRIGIRCSNDGCGWVGKHSEMQNHGESCLFMQIQCPNGCAEIQRRDRLDEHLATCPLQQVLCTFCKVKVRRLHFPNHEQNCSEGVRHCPLQCGEQLQRSRIHLHLNDCPKRFVKCTVKGWNNYYALGAEKVHDLEYQESHQALLKNEVERLKSVLFNKADEKVEREIKNRKSFRWTIKVADLADGKDVASPPFRLERGMFRCIWRRPSPAQQIVLENVASSKPLTVRGRFTLLKDGDVAKTFENRFPEILHEGRAISTEVDFGHPRHDQLELEIKVDIAIYSYI